MRVEHEVIAHPQRVEAEPIGELHLDGVHAARRAQEGARQEQDAWAARSQQRAASAQAWSAS